VPVLFRGKRNNARGVKQFLSQNRQFLLYCVIGMSGTTLDFSVYSLLLKSRLLDYQAANAIGYASGTLLSFILNARFNFRVSDRIAQRLVCFFGVAVLGWTISAGLLHEFIGNWHCNKYLAKLGTLVVVMLVQYNLNRWFSFRKSDD
jgi:putative flippase GtrA